MTSPPDDVYEAAARAYDVAGSWTDPIFALRAAVDSAYAAGVAAGRAQAAAAVERPSSGLCTCDGYDGPPTSPKTGTRMDHHCDCVAVETAATMLGAYSATVHARQCGHGTEFDWRYVAEGGDPR